MSVHVLPDLWSRLSPDVRDSVLRKLIERRRKSDARATLKLRIADRASETLPASLEQSLFLRQFDRFGDRLAWTIGAPPIVLDNIDAERAKAALSVLQRRHDVLRMRFERIPSGFAMKIAKDAPLPFTAGKVPLKSALLGPEEWVSKRYAAMLALPFDPWKGPLWRAELYTFAGRGVLLLNYCSAIVDGESVYMLEREIRHMLDGGAEGSLPEMAVDYADYAFTQQQFLLEGKMDVALEWGRERLSGGPPATWIDGRAPLSESRLYEQTLARKTTRALDAYAAAHRTTPHTVLLTEFMRLIRDIDASDDIWVSSASASRDLPGCETMIGTFARQSILRYAWPKTGDPLAGIHGAMAELMDQPPIPHLLIHNLLEAAYPQAPSAFRYVFNHRLSDPMPGNRPDHDIAFKPSPDFSSGEREEDILLLVMPSDEQRRLHWYLRSDRFAEADAKALLERYHAALIKRLDL